MMPDAEGMMGDEEKLGEKDGGTVLTMAATASASLAVSGGDEIATKPTTFRFTTEGLKRIHLLGQTIT